MHTQTNHFASTIAFNTQKPESRTIYLPVPKYDESIRNNKPAVLPIALYGRQRRSGAFFPSTISITNRIVEIPQQALWYSFPNGWGLRGQNTHPGQVHLLCQIDMLMSRHTIQAATKVWAMFLLQAQIIWRTCQNLSMKLSGGTSVKMRF